VLVLYRDEETHEKKCDYLRFWSKASSSADFHHAALRAVKKHLTGEDAHPLGRGGRVKNLRRLYVWTDGHGSTYKGFQNFGRMAQWPHSRTQGDADPDVYFLLNSFEIESHLRVLCSICRVHLITAKESKLFTVSLRPITLQGFKTALERTHG
jgi:hypothetical protein